MSEQRYHGVDTGLSPEVRMQLLKQHGDFSVAYSATVQPCLNHFGDEHGFIAWSRRWGVSLALGDPLTSDRYREELIRGFMEHTRRPVFCQVSRPTAEVLSSMGYRINEFGVDTKLNLGQYTLAGKQKEWLRYAYNWVHRRGYRIEEANFDAVDVAQVEEVSEAWRSTRTVKHKEVRFLNRPIVLDDEPDVRRFFLFDPTGKMLAFVFFDPLYSCGEIVGYVTCIKRRHPEAPQYAEHAIMKFAIERMKDEGVGHIRLGLSPLAWIEDDHFHHGRKTSKAFRFIFKSKLTNRWGYNLLGHAHYKRRFRGEEEKLYYASRSNFNVHPLLALLAACGIA